jgi:TonB family protein
VFEKVAAAQTVRPPWLRPWGVSAAAAAHAAFALSVASIPLPPEDPPRTVESATFLVLQQAARAPDPPTRLAAAAPRASAGSPGSEGGEARPAIADLRLVPPGEADAVPEIAPVPTSFDGAADLRSLAASAVTARGLSAAALLAGSGAGAASVVPAELLAEAPRLVNREYITRLLVRLYPRRLRAAGVQGEVMLTFIIGVDGRVEMRSVKVVETAHPDLTEPTLHALSVMRFRPARVEREPVRVRANLPVRWVLYGALAQAR